MKEELNLKVDLSRLPKDERDEFKRLAEKASCESRVWKPKAGEAYYTIRPDYGGIFWVQWNGDEFDEFRWTIGLVFKTKEEAEFALEKMKVKVELERYMQEYNDPELKEWNSKNDHYYIRFDYYWSTISVDFVRGDKYNDISFTSKEIAENAIAEIGEKRIIKYLFGVDCEEDE